MYRTDGYSYNDAFEQAFYQHKDMVYSIALTAVQNTQEAEEITLQTFREAQETITMRSHNQTASQLLQIAVMESLRIVSNRDGGIPYSGAANNYFGNEDDDFTLPGEYAEHPELKRRMMQAIDALPIYQRLALVMYIYNHLTIRAMASALRCSENTVRAHLCSAKAAVRQELEEIAYRNGEYFNSAEMVPFSRVYSGLIAEQAMSSQVATYLWDALQNTAERGAYREAPAIAPAPGRGLSSGSQIALWMSATATVLVLLTVCAIIGFSPKVSSKSASATEVETVLVYETEDEPDSSSVNESSSTTTQPERRPQPLPERRPEEKPKSSSAADSSSSSKPSSKSSSTPSSKSGSKPSSSSSSKPASSSSSPSKSKGADSSSSSQKEKNDVNVTVMLSEISGTYDEQTDGAKDNAKTLNLSSDGTVSLFSLLFKSNSNSSGYQYASITNLGQKSDGIYTFTASNGDSPLSGTKFTYYSSGTPISKLPFSSAYFETDGSTLKTAVVIDSSNTVYK